MALSLSGVPVTQMGLWAVGCGESVHLLVGTVGKVYFLLRAHL